MRLKLTSLFLLFLLLVPLSISAQDTTVENNTDVGISVEYPASWASDVFQIGEGIDVLYLADSDDTLDRIVNDPTNSMRSGRLAMIHYAPDFVNQVASSLEEL